MSSMTRSRPDAQKGAVLFLALASALVLSTLTMHFIAQAQSRRKLAEQVYRQAVVRQLAEAGVHKARWQLNQSGSARVVADPRFYEHRGYRGGFLVTAAPQQNGFKLVSRSRVGRDGHPDLARCEIDVDLKRIDGRYEISAWEEHYHW